jgi:hypothetical protein
MAVLQITRSLRQKTRGNLERFVERLYCNECCVEHRTTNHPRLSFVTRTSAQPREEGTALAYILGFQHFAQHVLVSL